MRLKRYVFGIFLSISAAALHAQDPDLGRNLAATCANCHGTNGNAIGEAKSLAGQPADEIIQKVADFRSGDQPATLMHQIAPGYTEAQIKLIAEFFAAQK